MTRVKRGCIARNRRNIILSETSGYYGSHSSLFRTAMQQRIKALRYNYQDRKKKRRNLRSLWTNRIGAVARLAGKNYNKLLTIFAYLLIVLNRRSISQLSIFDYTSYLMASLKK